MRYLCPCLFFLLIGTTLTAQDTLSFGGIYDLPGAEVRAAYEPVSPLAQSFTVEEVYRLPSTFYDPARLVALLPGVVQSNDQANHLSVRGNSPNANLWRLNGLAIVNPNHTANAGTFYDFPALNGGGVNAISAQMLDNSGFIAGGLPLEYGYANGGTFDLRLRPGSKLRRKYQLQAGFIGFDGTAEGPIGNGGRTSYLVNARYSFTGLLADMGVDFGGESIRFADVNAHLHHEDSWGEVSLFGLWGRSSNEFRGTSLPGVPVPLEEQKELFDIDFYSGVVVVGATGRWNFNKSVLRAGMGYSDQPETDRTQRLRVLRGDNIISSISQERTSAFVNWKRTLGDRFEVTTGAEWLSQTTFSTTLVQVDAARDTNNMPLGLEIINRGFLEVNSLSPYVGISLTDDILEASVGMRYSAYWGNGQHEGVWEPRVTVDFDFPFGRIFVNGEYVSRTYSNAILTQRERNAEGLATESVQISLGYGSKIGPVAFRVTGFAQRTMDAPAARTDGVIYSADNLLEYNPFLEFNEMAHTRRYGVELEAAGGRKDEGWYYRGNLTFFNSTVEVAPDSDTWVKNRFAADFVGKFTVGREWPGTDRRQRQRTFGLNAALIAHGGERYGRIVANIPDERYPILNYFQQPDYSAGLVNDLGTYFRPDLRLYKTKVRAKTTTTLALDIQNVAGVQNVGNIYYDFLLQEPRERTSLGLIPVLSYRIAWR